MRQSSYCRQPFWFAFVEILNEHSNLERRDEKNFLLCYLRFGQQTCLHFVEKKKIQIRSTLYYLNNKKEKRTEFKNHAIERKRFTCFTDPSREWERGGSVLGRRFILVNYQRLNKHHSNWRPHLTRHGHKQFDFKREIRNL